jgi:nicotinate-nucleotide adenylyltransferase
LKYVGVLGGSFNPIHVAHLILAERAREALALERVIFVPAKHPPHKPMQGLASGRDRLEMVRTAIEGNLAFEVSDIELRRRGVSYTIQTVEALRRELGAESEICFLIGTDTLAELPTWREIRRLASLCRFVPFARPGSARPDKRRLTGAVGRAEARAILARAAPMPLLDISSSDIRRRVAGGRSIRYLVPDAVAAYIRRRGLYRPPGGARR